MPNPTTNLLARLPRQAAGVSLPFLSRINLGMRHKLYSAFALAASLTVVSAAVAWVSYRSVNTAVDTVGQKTMPTMVSALTLARQTAMLTAAAPVLAGAATPQDYQASKVRLQQMESELRSGLDALSVNQGFEKDRIAGIAAKLDRLNAEIKALDAAVTGRLQAAGARTAVANTMVAERERFAQIIVPAIDDAVFDMAVTLSSVNPQHAGADIARSMRKLSDGPFVVVQELLGLVAEVNQVVGLYNEIAQAPRPELLVPMQDRYTAAAERIRKSLGLVKSANIAAAKELGDRAEALLALGAGDKGLPALRRAELAAMAATAKALDAAAAIAEQLNGDMVSDVSTAETRNLIVISTLNETIAASETTQLVLAAVSVLVAFLVAYLIVYRGVVRPIGALTGAMGRLAEKDWTAAIPSLERRDEIGRMARTVGVFKENGLENERLQREAAEAQQRELDRQRELAEKDRQAAEEKRRLEGEARQAEERRRAEAERDRQAAAEEAQRRRKQELSSLAEAFEASVKGVVETVIRAAQDMRATADAMAANAAQTSQQAQAAGAASEHAAGSVRSAAAASEELAASIQEIGRQVAHSASKSRDASAQAGQTNKTVQSLSEAAQKIGQVVELINQIAGQTNLLALNATIEAARAGEAGKGFAVVASEVKTLANQTARATDDISRQVAGIQASTGEAVEAIRGISATIAEIDTIAGTVTNAVEQQSAATGEISRSVQQASAGTSELNQNIAGVTGAAKETGEAAQRMQQAAEALSREAERLSEEVDGFIKRIRAA
jgi:methyl-accepting chemotaxis protein